MIVDGTANLRKGAGTSDLITGVNGHLPGGLVQGRQVKGLSGQRRAGCQ
jgi:hypothetical protein